MLSIGGIIDVGANRQASEAQLPTPSRSRFRLSGSDLGSSLFYGAEASIYLHLFLKPVHVCIIYDFYCGSEALREGVVDEDGLLSTGPVTSAESPAQ